MKRSLKKYLKYSQRDSTKDYRKFDQNAIMQNLREIKKQAKRNGPCWVGT